MNREIVWDIERRMARRALWRRARTVTGWGLLVSGGLLTGWLLWVVL